eukprot:6178586-Pleurochrysis_carterae.AAC.4
MDAGTSNQLHMHFTTYALATNGIHCIRIRNMLLEDSAERTEAGAAAPASSSLAPLSLGLPATRSLFSALRCSHFSPLLGQPFA